MRGSSELYKRKVFQASVTDDSGSVEKIETYQIGILIRWMQAQTARLERRSGVKPDA